MFLFPDNKQQLSDSEPEEGIATVPEPNVLIRGVIEQAFCKQLEVYISVFGEQMPHILVELRNESSDVTNRIYLPSGLFRDKAEVFSHMIKDNVIPENTSYTWLYKVWDRHFPHVAIKRWMPFCKCQECVDLLERLRLCKTEEDKKKVSEEKATHRLCNSLTRQRMHCRYNIPEHFSEEVCVISIDGMDNAKTDLPHQAVVSKDVDGAGLPLSSKLVGARVFAHGFFGFWTLPRYEQGASCTGTIVLKTLQLLEERLPDCKLPPVLILQLDNCGRENKNQYLIRLLSLLIQRGSFIRVELHFLPVGHTHSQIDQLFSVVYRHTKAKNIYSLPEMVASVNELFASLGFCYNEEVQDIIDLKTMTDSFSHVLKGLGTARDPDTGRKISIHSIRLEKGPDGMVRLWYKEDDAAGQWLGHWQNRDDGVLIFRDTWDKVIPPLAPGIRKPLDNLSKIHKRYLTLLKSSAKYLKATDDIRAARSGNVPSTSAGLHTSVADLASREEQRLSSVRAWITTLIQDECQYRNLPIPTEDDLFSIDGDPDSNDFLLDDSSNFQPEPFPELQFVSSYPSTVSNTMQLSDLRVHTLLLYLDDPLAAEFTDPTNPAYVDVTALYTDVFKNQDWSTLSQLEAAVQTAKASLPRNYISGDFGRREVFVCHEKDNPPIKQSYDPNLDAHRWHIGVAHIVKEDTLFERGWELVQLTSEPYEIRGAEGAIKVIDLVYLEPCTLNADGSWPEQWADRKFRAMKVRSASGRFQVYAQKCFPLSNIAWSTEPKMKDDEVILQIPCKKVRGNMVHTIHRIEEWHKQNPNAEAQQLLDAGNAGILPRSPEVPMPGENIDED